MDPEQGIGLTRRRLLQALVVGAAGGWGCGRGRRGGRPSFLVLVTDDQRADTLGCTGNPVIRTPVLDRLAADGVLFERAFVTTSSCPSSRASIFTGQYMRRHGVRDFRTPLAPDALRRSYPLLLRASGYRTGFVGKWGLGGPLPWSAFDRFDGFEGQGSYFDDEDPQRRHLTGVLADRATEFLEEDDGRPFCLSVSFKAPHGPWFFDPALADLYRGQPIPVAPTATLDEARRMRADLRDSMVGHRGVEWLADREAHQERLRAYYRMITGVDRAVGRILEALGPRRDVVVLYTSDNGLLVGEHGFVGKHLMQEESIRVPLVVYDPRLPESARGRRIQEMALNIDVAPTLLELAGVPIPSETQGRSLAPLLRGESVAWREDWFYEFELETGWGVFPTVEGVRTPDWKYVRYLGPGAGREELYDLGRDGLETEDLSGRPEQRERLAALRRRWEDYRTALR